VANPDPLAYIRTMTETERRALEFVRTTKGGATREAFEAMHAPLGPILLPKLSNAGYLRVASDGRIHLTQGGSAALNASAPYRVG
jgi:hypothetical protein